VRRGGGQHFRAHGVVAEQLRQLAENLQMAFVGVLGNQQDETQGNRLVVGGVEFQRGFQPVKRTAGILQAFDAAVRNGDSVAERGRPEAFALEQAGENIRGLERVGSGEQFGCVFEQLSAFSCW